VPIDTLAKMERERGVPVTVDKASKHGGLDWDVLREKVKGGIRNATLMAVAPNANIGLLAGTTPGIDARFAQVFSRNKISGKYLEVNPNMVHDLKTLGIWDKVQEDILKNHGDIQSIDLIPDGIKRIYKTSFDTTPGAFVEVAARAQKWVDQAISRNMYLAVNDIDEVMNIYTNAWEKGLKTTYYLHMKPKHTAEQSTVSVNKATAIGKKGFAALFANAAPAVKVETAQAEVKVSVATAVKVEVPEKTPEPLPIIADIIKQEEPAPETPVDLPKKAPFASVAPKMKQMPTLVLPDDPQNANICEGCE
jgi:ribonucleoside-diphosphate reductase alpha chain